MCRVVISTAIPRLLARSSNHNSKRNKNFHHRDTKTQSIQEFIFGAELFSASPREPWILIGTIVPRKEIE
jgi:hypothetical protein